MRFGHFGGDWVSGGREARVEVGHKGSGQLTLVRTVNFHCLSPLIMMLVMMIMMMMMMMISFVMMMNDKQREMTLLSYDARRGSWNLGARWSDNGQFGTRAYFQVMIII